jgi:hypothetical protein
MKAFKFTCIATALMACLCTATTTHAQKIYLGIKAGANFDKTNGDHLDGSFQGHILGGVYGGVRFSMVRIQAELLFTQSTVTTGDNFSQAFGQYVNNGVSNVKNGNFKTSELAIPVTVGVNIVPKLLWICAGPQYTGVVSTKNVDQFFNDSKDIVNKGYMSGVVGAELELPFKLNAGVRYIFGLSDRNNTDVNESWKTNQFQLHVGFTIL